MNAANQDSLNKQPVISRKGHAVYFNWFRDMPINVAAFISKSVNANKRRKGRGKEDKCGSVKSYAVTTPSYLILCSLIQNNVQN